MAIYRIMAENRAVFGGEKFSRRIRSEYEYSEKQKREMLEKMVHKFRVKDADGVTYFWGVSSDPNSTAPLDIEGRSTDARRSSTKTRKRENIQTCEAVTTWGEK